MVYKYSIFTETWSLALGLIQFLIDIPFFVYALMRSISENQWQKLTVKPKSLDNEIILITGATSGLGKQLTTNIAKLATNATIILWGSHLGRLTAIADDCKELGVNNVYTYIVDLSVQEQVVQTAIQINRTIGTVSILINNAATTAYKTFWHFDAKEEEKILRVNLLSQMWTIRAFLPGMIRKGKGHIVSTCSGLAFHRFRYVAPYVASKHGLRGFLETLRLELELHPAKPKIPITVIYPGWIKTPMAQGITWKPRYNWKILMPVDAELVAENVLDGILREDSEIFFPAFVKHLNIWSRYLPTSFINWMEDFLLQDVTLDKDDKFVK